MGTETQLVKVEHLYKEFDENTKVLEDINLTINKNEVIAILGPSGTGKSTLLRCLNYLTVPTKGKITIGDVTVDAQNHTKKDVIELRKHSSMVFQGYNLFKNKTALENVMEALTVVQKKSKAEAEKIALELLDKVGMSERKDFYPSKLSGGQQQRVGIARALAVNPKLIVCDEPVSALDVSIQAQVLNLLDELKEEMDLTYLFIAHGLKVVKHISDRVGVMYLGKLVEIAPKKELYKNPLHPYTRALLSAAPVIGEKNTKNRIILSGDVPSPINPPEGCRFHSRCYEKDGQCPNYQPELKEVTPGHFVACCHCGK